MSLCVDFASQVDLPDPGRSPLWTFAGSLQYGQHNYFLTHQSVFTLVSPGLV